MCLLHERCVNVLSCFECVSLFLYLTVYMHFKCMYWSYLSCLNFRVCCRPCMKTKTSPWDNHMIKAHDLNWCCSENIVLLMSALSVLSVIDLPLNQGFTFTWQETIWYLPKSVADRAECPWPRKMEPELLYRINTINAK